MHIDNIDTSILQISAAHWHTGTAFTTLIINMYRRINPPINPSNPSNPPINFSNPPIKPFNKPFKPPRRTSCATSYVKPLLKKNSRTRLKTLQVFWKMSKLWPFLTRLQSMLRVKTRLHRSLSWWKGEKKTSDGKFNNLEMEILFTAATSACQWESCIQGFDHKACSALVPHRRWAGIRSLIIDDINLKESVSSEIDSSE